jgi:hypothetical protein
MGIKKGMHIGCHNMLFLLLVITITIPTQYKTLPGLLKLHQLTPWVRAHLTALGVPLGLH